MVLFVACGDIKEDNPVTIAVETKEDRFENENNRVKIAEALGVDREDRCIKYILAALFTVDAGDIQSAIYSDTESGKILDVLSENGSAFKILLTDNLSVEAIQRVETGDWIITSER